MSELSNFLEDKILDITLKGGTAYNVATPYIALYTADPTDADVVANEVNDTDGWTDYQRVAATFGTISNGTVSNSGVIEFAAQNGATPVTVTHFGICASGTKGTQDLLYHSKLKGPGGVEDATGNKTLNQTDIISFADGSITVTAD